MVHQGEASKCIATDPWPLVCRSCRPPADLADHDLRTVSHDSVCLATTSKEFWDTPHSARSVSSARRARCSSACPGGRYRSESARAKVGRARGLARHTTCDPARRRLGCDVCVRQGPRRDEALQRECLRQCSAAGRPADDAKVAAADRNEWRTAEPKFLNTLSVQ